MLLGRREVVVQEQGTKLSPKSFPRANQKPAGIFPYLVQTVASRRSSTDRHHVVATSISSNSNSLPALRCSPGPSPYVQRLDLLLDRRRSAAAATLLWRCLSNEIRASHRYQQALIECPLTKDIARCNAVAPVRGRACSVNSRAAMDAAKAEFTSPSQLDRPHIDAEEFSRDTLSIHRDPRMSSTAMVSSAKGGASRERFWSLEPSAQRSAAAWSHKALGRSCLGHH